MIFVEIGGYGTTQIEYTDGMTADAAMVKLKAQEKVHFATAYSLQETKTGRVLDPSEPLIDGRIYYLTATLHRA